MFDNDHCTFRACHLQADEQRPILAVDIGYSSRGKSCGVHWTGASRPENLTFGQAIEAVAERLIHAPETILALEAVLSTYHAYPTGNPALRGEFERGRGWYWGPGAVSCLAAQRFLRMIHKRLAPGQQILLGEAFLSNKSGPSKHSHDARVIVEQFWNAPVHQPVLGAEPLPPIEGIPPVRVFKVDNLGTSDGD